MTAIRAIGDGESLRGRDRQRGETDRQTDRHRGRERQTDRHRGRERQTDRDGERQLGHSTTRCACPLDCRPQ